MRRYKIRRYKDCEYLSHEDRKKHKYVAKIKLGKNKYRYFYTKKEYDAYLHKKKAVGDISNKAKSVVDNIGDKIKKASDFVNSKSISRLFKICFTLSSVTVSSSFLK